MAKGSTKRDRSGFDTEISMKTPTKKELEKRKAALQKALGVSRLTWDDFMIRACEAMDLYLKEYL